MNPLDWLDLGVAVIPVFWRTKKPEVAWSKYQRELPDRQLALTWFRPGRQCNAAVVCGWQGLTVLDFDTIAAYDAWLSWAKPHTPAAQTYRVRTSRGMHVYVFADDVPRCGHFDGGDIKGKGGYVLIPPSCHPSGHTYVSDNPGAAIVRVASIAAVLPTAPRLSRPTLPPLVHVYPASSLWPQTTVEQIKDQIRIEDLISEEIQQTGSRWLMTVCPFHDDHSPSLRIDTSANVAFCFSGCTAKPLDVIAFYARLQHIDNRTAVQQLARRL